MIKFWDIDIEFLIRIIIIIILTIIIINYLLKFILYWLLLMDATSILLWFPQSRGDLIPMKVLSSDSFLLWQSEFWWKTVLELCERD